MSVDCAELWPPYSTQSTSNLKGSQLQGQQTKGQQTSRALNSKGMECDYFVKTFLGLLIPYNNYYLFHSKLTNLSLAAQQYWACAQLSLYQCELYCCKQVALCVLLKLCDSKLRVYFTIINVQYTASELYGSLFLVSFGVSD